MKSICYNNQAENLCYITRIMILLLFFIFAIKLTSAMDLYEIIGVDKTASAKDIRKAFKKLATTEHPDKKMVCVACLFESLNCL